MQKKGKELTVSLTKLDQLPDKLCIIQLTLEHAFSIGAVKEATIVSWGMTKNLLFV